MKLSSDPAMLFLILPAGATRRYPLAAEFTAMAGTHPIRNALAIARHLTATVEPRDVLVLKGDTCRAGIVDDSFDGIIRRGLLGTRPVPRKSTELAARYLELIYQRLF